MDQPAFDISVCICTHNPRRDYLTRVIEALAAQTLDPDAWELVMIDNRSDEPVGSWVDLTAIRNARIVSEERLGLTHARLKGINEARGEVLVFVDDDNLLQTGYLEHARRIMQEKPFLGAIGGRCRGEFEITPPRWSWHYWPYLAVADHGEHALYTFHRNTYQSWYPYGAGLVIRRALAEHYSAQLALSPERRKMDRCGDSLNSAGDIDMVLTVMDAGSAIGFFPELLLKHIIPAERLKLAYLKRMIYHANYSLYQLMFAREIDYRPRRWPLAYITAVLLCFTHGYWHPKTLWLACQAARGRYAAYHDYLMQRAALQANAPRSARQS